MSEKGVLLVVSGFSGAGKGTIVKKVLSERDDVSLSISMTTRSPREGEVNGREYFFVTKEEFEKAIEDGELLEHAQYVNNYYGTPKSYVLDELNKGRNVLLEIETQGALQVKERFPEAVLVFVTTPDVETLAKRLKGRGTETDEVIKNRLDKAKLEVDVMQKYNFILVNDDLDKCVKELYTLIEASLHAPACNESLLESIKEGFKTI